eukprot:4684268-Lingulodinium_polyedra.AAC.1
MSRGRATVEREVVTSGLSWEDTRFTAGQQDCRGTTKSPGLGAASAVADSHPESSPPAGEARSQRRPAAGDAPRMRSFFLAATAAR